MSLIDLLQKSNARFLAEPVSHVQEAGRIARTRVCHVASLEQMPGDSACGYYGLHNLRQLMRARGALMADDTSQAQAHIRSLTDKAAFEATKEEM